MSWLRRMAGFALVPLSLLPLGAIAPLVAPSVEQRIDVLHGRSLHPHANTGVALPTGGLLTVAPLVTYGPPRPR